MDPVTWMPRSRGLAGVDAQAEWGVAVGEDHAAAGGGVEVRLAPLAERRKVRRSIADLF